MDDDLLDDAQADRLLAQLGDALSSEITDDHLAAATRAFWTARTDALIAEFEEHLDAGERAGVRGVADERGHVYRLGDLSVSLTVDAVDRRVAGRIDGAAVGARWLDAGGSSRPLALDERGRFSVAPPTGPIAIEITLADGRRVRTSWTLL